MLVSSAPLSWTSISLLPELRLPGIIVVLIVRLAQRSPLVWIGAGSWLHPVIASVVGFSVPASIWAVAAALLLLHWRWWATPASIIAWIHRRVVHWAHGFSIVVHSGVPSPWLHRRVPSLRLATQRIGGEAVIVIQALIHA